MPNLVTVVGSSPVIGKLSTFVKRQKYEKEAGNDHVYKDCLCLSESVSDTEKVVSKNEMKKTDDELVCRARRTARGLLCFKEMNNH